MEPSINSVTQMSSVAESNKLVGVAIGLPTLYIFFVSGSEMTVL